MMGAYADGKKWQARRCAGNSLRLLRLDPALHHQFAGRIGLLKLDAPVVEGLQRDRGARDGAADEVAALHDLEIGRAVDQLGLDPPGHAAQASNPAFSSASFRS